MLTDQEKQKLREEEIYREEVRKELSASIKLTVKERVWKFVNSAIFLWFLGSVALAGIVGAGYFGSNRATDFGVMVPVMHGGFRF